MADGAYESHWWGHTQHPQGIHLMWARAWTRPMRQCITSTTVSVGQPWVVADDAEWAHEDAHGKWSTLWGRPPAAPSTAGHEHLILRLFGDSPTTLLRGEGPTWGRRLAPHHQIKVRSALLYRVSEDSVCRLAAQRLSRSLVGIIHHRITNWSPRSIGQVLHHFLWPSPLGGPHVPQAVRVPQHAIGKPLCLWVLYGVQQPCTLQGAPHWHGC
jgi:hypothetical protein